MGFVPQALALVAAAVLLAGCTAPSSPAGPATQNGGLPGATSWVWTEGKTAPLARSEVSAGSLEEKIYVVGGFVADGSDTRAVARYDAEKDAWSAMPEYPLGIHHTGVVVGPDGSVFVLGGASSASFAITNLAFRLDPSAGLWLPLPPLPAPRFGHGAALVDGKIYLIGGLSPGPPGSSGLPFAERTAVDVLDTTTNVWSTAPDLPTGRDHLSVVTHAGKIYAVGGDQGGHDSDLDTLEVLDPAAGKWSRLAPMPVVRGAFAAAVVGDRIVVTGGENTTETFASTYAYDIGNDSWSQLPDTPEPKHGFGAAGWGGRYYALLGSPVPLLGVTDRVQILGPAAN